MLIFPDKWRKFLEIWKFSNTCSEIVDTQAGNFKQSGNFLCHDRKKIYYFCTIKVSGHMLEVSRHTSETFTNLEMFKHTP